MERKKLSDILRGNASGADWVNDNWGDIPAAPDFGTPIPRGQYVAHVIDGVLFTANTGTPGYKLTFEVIEGDFVGRKLWHDVWLSAKAKGQAVRDLAKLGIRNREQLEQPIPSRRIRCRVTVVIRKDNDGIERNETRSFEVLGIDPPPAADPFAPSNGDGKADSDAEEDGHANGVVRNGELFQADHQTGPCQEGR